MSLTREQQQNTIDEFAENMRKLDVTAADIAASLGSSPSYVDQVVHLHARNLEDPWVVRNWLIERGRERGIELEPFTALTGDWHRYWFLDGGYIDRGRLAL